MASRESLLGAFVVCVILATAYLVVLIRAQRRSERRERLRSDEADGLNTAANAEDHDQSDIDSQSEGLVAESRVVLEGHNYELASEIEMERTQTLLPANSASSSRRGEVTSGRNSNGEFVAGLHSDADEDDESFHRGGSAYERLGRRFASRLSGRNSIFAWDFSRFLQSGLPWPVLVVSFLNSFVLSFPMNFFGLFISNEIGMTPTEFTQYYALTFLPFSFKPLYAYMAERVHICGTGRRGYLMACNIMISVCMMCMATLAHEVWHVFLIGFMQNFFEAAAGMVVGLILIDTAYVDQSKIPKLQAEQTMWRYLGTFSALLLALPVSGCFSYSWDNRSALIASAVIPLFSAIAAQWLPTKKPSSSDFEGRGDEMQESDRPLRFSSDQDYDDVGVDDQSEDNSVTSFDARQNSEMGRLVERQAIMLFVPTLVLFECVAIAVGLHGNFAASGALSTWHILVGVFIGTLLIWLIVAGTGVYRWGNPANIRALMVISVPCIYLFVVDAIPSSLDGMASYKYHVFHQPCQLQAMSLLGTVSRIAGLFAYSKFFSNTTVEIAVLTNTILSASVSLLDMYKVQDPPLEAPFWPWTLIDIVGSFVSALYLVSKEVVATHYSFSLLNTARKRQRAASTDPRVDDGVADNGDFEEYDDAEQAYAHQRLGSDKHSSWGGALSRTLSPGILYSVYLTCFDIGASASGFLTAAIMSALGVTYTDFSALPDLILICALSFICTVILIPTLTFAKHG
mmetsp:Transcript_15910/g.30795  ORF Transcript_15910/g.30795 Transcript_15910/m.30795 type:complete len:741 (+) Transcript_15910:72-2294(+)|eukprot:CAMPEP_0171568796 /NCGR_PEP_ID=MMETSP0961-20121227/1978_1 /TAXON_ID=87120 /ORGANISM="Aurantiochytrium limacinum, Strain ATCCMYA-1381" /LENGTH=740 /DNA_ID=CAMNT_0012122995 /DNA_START=59 /DNA_END=2281 /DNA_ORIENTATION=-